MVHQGLKDLTLPNHLRQFTAASFDVAGSDVFASPVLSRTPKGQQQLDVQFAAQIVQRQIWQYVNIRRDLRPSVMLQMI